MVEDIDFSSLYNDSIDQPFSCSGDNTFGNSKPKLSNFRKSLPFDRYDNSLNDELGDDVIMYETKDSDENIWNGNTYPYTFSSSIIWEFTPVVVLSDLLYIHRL